MTPDLFDDAAARQPAVGFSAAAEIDTLIRRAIAAKGRRVFSELFDLIARCKTYSIFNMMLVYLQRPGAAAVGTERRWSDLGRRVRPGAIPIIVLRPRGPVMTVFEIADTEGPQQIGTFSATLFGTRGELAPGTWDRTVKRAGRQDRLRIEISPLGLNRAGDVQTDVLRGSWNLGREHEVPRFYIRIAQWLPQTSQYVTLVHELAHVFCGHLGKPKGAPWPDRHNHLSKAQRELEAEAVAYLVSSRAGIETRAAEYLAGYISDGDVEKISVAQIVWAANHIEKLGAARGT